MAVLVAVPVAEALVVVLMVVVVDMYHLDYYGGSLQLRIRVVGLWAVSAVALWVLRIAHGPTPMLREPCLLWVGLSVLTWVLRARGFARLRIWLCLVIVGILVRVVIVAPIPIVVVLVLLLNVMVTPVVMSTAKLVHLILGHHAG